MLGGEGEVGDGGRGGVGVGAWVGLEAEAEARGWRRGWEQKRGAGGTVEARAGAGGSGKGCVHFDGGTDPRLSFINKKGTQTRKWQVWKIFTLVTSIGVRYIFKGYFFLF